MKKIFFALSLFLLAAIPAFAQDTQDEDPDWRTYLPRHEVSFGIGDPFIANCYSYEYSPLFWDRFDYGDNHWLEDNQYFHGNMYSTFPISFSYLYRVTKFLWLGGTACYHGIYGKRYNATTDCQEGYISENYITLMPTIRFSYLNKKYVTLYSGLSTGVVIGIINPTNPNNFSVQAHFAGQLTAIGVSAGHKWFGFTELGVGYKGFICAGFGYRFNNEKSNR